MRRPLVFLQALVLGALALVLIQILWDVYAYAQIQIERHRTLFTSVTGRLEHILRSAADTLSLFRRASSGRLWSADQLMTLVSGHPTFEHLHLLDPDGVVIGSTDPKLVGKDRSTQPLFRESRLALEIHPVEWDPDSRRARVYVSTPWFFSGQKTGVLLGQVRWEASLRPALASIEPSTRVVLLTGMREPVMYWEGANPGPIAPERLPDHLGTVFLRQVSQGFLNGLDGRLVVGYGNFHPLTRLAVWVESDIDWRACLNLERNLVRILLLLGLFVLILLALQHDRAWARRDILEIDNLIRDISNRKPILTFPKPRLDDLTILVRDLEELYQNHFLSRGPVIENEIYFERLIEHSSDFIVLTNFSGKIHYVSKSLARAFHVRESDLVGKDLTEIVAISRERWFLIVNDLMQSQGVTRHRAEVRFNDVTMVLESQLSVMPASLDQEPMIVVNARDITQQEQLTEALARQEKIHTLSQFSSGVAHDFSNLLMNIMGYLTLAQLKLKDGDASALEEINHSQKEILRARTLIQSLITVSQGGVYQPQDIEVLPIIQEVWKTLSVGTRARFHVEGEVGAVVWADREKLYAIFNEVLGNALHFMGSDGLVVVKIAHEERARPSVKEGAIQVWVRVSVIDSGPGIPEDFLKKVFDPYVSTRSEGRGLGLSMVNAAMEAMGGWIDIQSRVGMGTTVNLHFKPGRVPPR